MAKGGARKNAGRPRTRDYELLQPRHVIIAEAIRGGLTPLEYMLNAMRDPNVSEGRRDRMAMAAAPYCHARVSDQRIGKKELAAEAARSARLTSDWSDDLVVTETHAN